MTREGDIADAIATRKPQLVELPESAHADLRKVRAAFGAATYERLVAVKNRYDPGNVFHLDQNVRPSGR